MDYDILFYSEEEMKSILRVFEKGKHDIAAVLDVCGGSNLWDKYPELFGENKLRAERSRIAPYMFMGTRKFLQSTSLDFAAGNDPVTHVMRDEVVIWTDEVLSKKPRFLELRDERHSMFMSDSGSLTWTANLDGSPYYWSIDGYSDIGYYRLRVRETEYPQTYEERLRVLAWYTILSEKYAKDDEWEDRIWDTLDNMDVAETDWNEYIETTKAYHSWVEEL